MTTEDNNECGFEHFSFRCEMREKFKEKWATMSDEEKLNFINKRMEGDEEDRTSFFVNMIDEKCKKWMHKSTEEKEAFINEKKGFFKNRRRFRHHPFFRGMGHK
jgi:hypothetical protein